MTSATEPASFVIDRVPAESATSECPEPLGLPAAVTASWARFAAPLVRTVFLARDEAGIAGAAITAGRPLSGYLKIAGIWTADRVGTGTRPALRRALAEAAEAFAWESGFAVVKRECPALTGDALLTGDAAGDGDEDAAPFTAAGYETVPAPEIAAPIPDPGPAVPAAQVKWRTRAARTAVPYMRQTTDFTCGPSALSMLLARYGVIERVNRTTELELWRAATTVMACDPYGLALAARGQGLTPRIVISADETLFLGEGATAQERELGRFIQAAFAGRAAQEGIEAERRAFGMAELATVIRDGGAAIVLVDEVLVHGDACPHWILVHAMDGDTFIAHDPWTETGQGESWVDGYDVPYPAASLDRIAWTGHPPVRAMLTFTGPPARTEETRAA
jgi:predicted double-glycine peptidase